MSTAKLSGSLLERKDASIGLFDHRPFADLEGTKSSPYPSASAVGPGNDQPMTATWGSASAPPAGMGSRRLGSMLGFAVIVCGVAVVTAAGTIFSMHRAAQSVSQIEPQSQAASAGMSSVALTRVIENSTVSQAAITGPNMSERSSTQLVTTAAPTSAAPTTTPAETHLTPQEVAALLTRGDVLLGNGDIVSARLCYERAAEGGNAQAALRLGESYDPAFLVQTQLNGVRGDRSAAARWYRRAIELGATEADTLLKSLGKP
jgi:hypothetical protein